MGRVVLAIGVICVASAPGRLSAQESADRLAWFATTSDFMTLEVREATITGRRRGLFVTVEGAELELRVETVTAPEFECVAHAGPRPVHGRTVTARRLVMRRGTTETTLLGVGEIEGSEYLTDRLVIHATLGPYVAVERRREVYGACAAHPSTVRSFIWVDLRDGRTVDIEPPIGSTAPVQQAVARLRRQLATDYPDEDWSDTSGRVEGMMAHWNGRAFVGRVYVAVDVAYAFSGGWSYQVDTHVDVRELGVRLEPFAAVPREVVGAMRRHRRWRLGGVSAAP